MRRKNGSFIPHMLIFHCLFSSAFSLCRRVLTWQYGFGMVTLTANFPKRKHYLSVSLYQTVVLLLFNDADMLTYSEVEEGSGLTGAELERALLSLSCGKHRVLLKNPKGPKISKSDTFTYAKDFCKQLVQLKVSEIEKPNPNSLSYNKRHDTTSSTTRGAFFLTCSPSTE